MMKTKLLNRLALIVFMTTTTFAAGNWKGKLQGELPLLGHRNWNVVAGAAYQLQTAPGIETIYVGADQLEVVKGIIAELAKTKHVKPTIYIDAEMKFVAETNTAGISAYRDGLSKVLSNQPVKVLPHEQIIAKLNEAGKSFKILLFKTPLMKPSMSVFFQLECGYWNADSEKQLRDTMKGAK